MQQEKSADRSTLSALHPSQALEVHWRMFKSSLRTHGSHILNLRKPTRNPESSRQYIKGDPINLIDWKAFARTDQLIVRQQHDEASARIAIGIDAGETMFWPGAEAQGKASPPPTKIELALRIGFNLAHLHLAMGDFVELWITSKEDNLPTLRYRPRSNVEVLSEFDQLLHHKFSMAELTKAFVETDFKSQKKPDVTYWLGDALGSANYGEFLSSAKKLRFFFHTLSSLETDVSWLENGMCYFDEWKVTKEYQGGFLLQQDNYQQAVAKWRKTLQDSVRKNQQGFYSLFTDQTSISEYQASLMITD